MNALPKDAISDIIQAIWKGPRTNIIWDGDPVGVPGPKTLVGVVGAPGGGMWPRLVLNLTSDTSNGSDEERTEFIAPDILLTTQITTGTCVVTITASEFSNQREAFDTCRLLRSRLQRDSVQVALEAVGMALAEAPTLRNLNLIIDKKTIPYASLECKFNYYLTDDVTGDKGLANGKDGWVETTIVGYTP